MTAMSTFVSFAATRLFFMSFLSLTAMANTICAAERIAVFGLELVRGAENYDDTDRLAADEARLALASHRLKELFKKSGKFELVDMSKAAAKAGMVHLQACGGCAADFAREAGAAIAITGEIHKTSELILSIHVYAHAADGRALALAAVDIRGNTDESWRRGIDYIFRNALLPRLEHALK
jgi:Protein of unknown function (DUF2380)